MACAVRITVRTYPARGKAFRTLSIRHIMPLGNAIGRSSQLRTFAEIFDYYQATIYEREMLTETIAELLSRTRSRLVLDCACGTGMPAIDLRARGFSVDCSDADRLMLHQFRKNARARKVDDSAIQLRWEDLRALGKQYDYVMCRGNSLAYANSWDETLPAASLSTIERQVRGIAAVVAPGGYLHIDAPRTSDLAEVSYPERAFRGERVRVTERVVLSDGGRRWEQYVFIGAEEFAFARNSANLTGAQLIEILRGNGFTDIKPVELAGERPSYQVLLARRGTFSRQDWQG
jgi:SAM-dependent methyltransferase